jgi:hypothetical protein
MLDEGTMLGREERCRLRSRFLEPHLDGVIVLPPAESACLRFTMLLLHEFDAADSRVPFETGRPVFLEVTEKTGL